MRSDEEACKATPSAEGVPLCQGSVMYVEDKEPAIFVGMQCIGRPCCEGHEGVSNTYSLR